jgi:hypothetical protein
VPFQLNIVSAVLKNGDLIVSWNSGIPATESFDYGIEDNTVPNTVPETLLKPGDRGYIPGENRKKFDTNHEMPFPTTFVDSEHYFRVRSTSRRGETLVSGVFMVYVTSKLMLQSEVASVNVDVKPITIHQKLAATIQGLESYPDKGLDPGANMEMKIEPEQQQLTVEEASVDGATTFETNLTLTVE